METRSRLLLLTLAPLALGGCASLHWPWHHPSPKTAQVTPPSSMHPPQGEVVESAAPEGVEPASAKGEVIEPQVARRKITVPKIRAKNVELGGYYGVLSIEDFGSAPVAGLRLDYHVTEDFFFEATAGRAKGGKTSFETLGGGVQLLSDSQRRFTYYNLSLGYNLLPGEVFIGRNRAMTSALYISGGMGAVRFGGDQHFSANLGTGFRVLPTDWLAIHVDLQDILFTSDLLGVSRVKNNLQAILGATVFF